MATHTLPVNGIDLHYELRGSGEPLLLLHGFLGSSGDFVHLFDLDDLARSHELVIPDQRGHGRSTNPGKTITHRQSALDVHALLDHLGIARVRAVGISMGGNTLLHMATQRPERVDAMVISGAASYFPAQARAIMAQVTVETRSEDEWRVMRGRHRLGDGQIETLWNQARGLEHSHEDMCFTPPLLATIRARTLIVDGDRDPFYPVEMFVEQYRAIPRASLWIIPDGGHADVFGEWREPFVRKALAFLRE